MHRPTLEQQARRDLGDRVAGRVDASDLVQQTFLEAHRAFDQFRGLSAAELAGWLRRALARNLAEAIRNHAQAQKRSRDRDRSLDASHGDGAAARDRLESGGTTPSQGAMRAEQIAQLLGALGGLPDDQREAVRLRHLEGRSLAEIAEILNRTPAATAGLIKRGLQGLRSRLRTEEGGTHHG